MTEQPMLTEPMTTEEVNETGPAKKVPKKKAPPPAKKPDIEITDGMLDLSNIDQLIRYSDGIYNSKYRPRDMSSADIMCAIQTGAELGMKPMAAVRSIAVINGRPSIWGDAIIGLCMRHPLWDEGGYVETIDIKNNVITATCTMARRGGQPVTRTFTTEDAKTAGYMGKDTYKKHPKRMIQCRARSWCAKDAFPDAMLGMMTAEEMQLADALDGVDLDKSEKSLVDRLKEKEAPPESAD